jgi:TRAP-type C4-dicarboxylate transport system substrate-binding protein
MNLKKWNSLPKDVQKVFEEVSEEWIAKRGEAWDSSDEEGRKFTLSRGNELIPLSEEENLRWLDAVIPVIGVYENDAQKKGLPGKTYTNSIVNLIRILSK